MNTKLILFIISFLLFLSVCSKKENRECSRIVNTVPTPEQEPVIVSEVPKPPGVLGWGAPKFTVDGSRISFGFAPPDNITKRFIGTIKEDGTDFQCLTCNLNTNAGAHVWFPDGERLIFYFFKLYEPNFFVLELSNPDIYYEIQNIATPGELTHDRFPVLSPDGKKLVWTKVRYDGFHIVMGDIIKDSNGYHVENVRHLYPPVISDEESPEQWALANAWYEAKSFTDGGKTLVFSATLAQAGNVDDFLLDLETGNVTRITSHPEWDEGAEFSPDGKWMVMESTRGQDVLSVITEIPLPPLIDFSLVLPITNITLAGPMFAPHEPFLLDRTGDRGDYFGQRLSTEGDEGWAVREGVHWHPDGTRVVWGAFLNPAQEDTHIRVARLTSRSPIPSQPIVTTPAPEWAPLLKDVPLRPSRVHKIFNGKHSGTAWLDIEGTIVSGNFSMRFDNYSSDGINTLNGEMSIEVPLAGMATLSADIKLSGCSSGFLQADLDINGTQVKGFIKSEKDGRKHEWNF